VVYHHVDLDAGYGFADAPLEVVVAGLRECVPRLTGTSPALEVTAELPDGDPVVLRVGAAEPRFAVRGPAPQVLAWLTGRSAGEGLRRDGGAALPELPSWG
jgi:maleylpyruvate isomerase